MAITIHRRQAGLGALPGYRDTSRDIAAGGAQQLAQAGMGVAQGVRAAGQGAAQALQTGAAVAQQVAKEQQVAAAKAKHEHDVAAVQGAQAELGQTGLELFDGGYAKQLGLNALAERDNTLKAYQAKGQELRSRLKGEEQQLAFDRHFAGEWESFQRRVIRHESTQGDVVAEEAHKAVISSTTSEAIQAASTGDHDVSRLALLKIRRDVETRGGALGLPAEVIDQQARAAQTRAMLGIVDSFLEAGRDQDAAEYFNLARPDMDEGMVTQGNMEARIASANTRIGSVRLAHEAWEQGGGAVGALAIIDEADVDPIVREGAMRRVTERRRAESAALKEADAEPLAKLLIDLELGKRFSDDDDRLQNLKSSTSRERALRRRRSFDNRHGLNGPTAKQEQTYKDDLFRLHYEQLTPEEQLNINLDELADAMDASDEGGLVKVKLAQARAKGRLQGQALVQANEFSSQLRVQIRQEHPGMKPAEQRELFQWIMGKWSRWRNTEGKDILPTQDVADGWKASFFVREKKRFLRTPKTRVQREMKGEDFEPTGDELPLAPPPKAAPARPGNITIVGPGGQTTVVADGPHLDEWLKRNTKWKRQ